MEKYLDLITLPYVPKFLGMWVTQIGIDSAGFYSNYHFNGQNRGNEKRCIWQFTLSGQGMLEQSGNSITVDEGEAMLLTLPDQHSYFLPKSSNKWEVCFLVIEGEVAYDLFRILIEQYGNIVKLNPKGQTLQFFKEILSLRKEKMLRTPYRIADYTFRFLLQLGEELESSEDTSLLPPFMQKVFTMIEENPLVGIGDLSRASGYCQVYFESIFKKYTGVTPHKFLFDLRMKNAVGMLENTNASVKEIAATCGFSDSAYFCRVFRKKHGRTPTSLRKFFMSSPTKQN